VLANIWVIFLLGALLNDTINFRKHSESVIDEWRIVERQGSDTKRGNQRTRRETFLSATAPTTNAIRTSLKLKMGLGGEKLATNHSNRNASMTLLMTKKSALWSCDGLSLWQERVTGVSYGVRSRPVYRADNITSFILRLCRNSGNFNLLEN